MTPEQFPLVVVAGMSRAGTTFLYHNLQRHPQIFVPKRKEVCYFAHNHDEGEGWFRRFFADRTPRQVAFDICGLYFMDPESLERIAAFDPEARVVIGVRDPIDWAFSLYEQYSGAFEVPPFEEFFSGCTMMREGKQIRLDFHSGMIEQTLDRFRAVFGDRLMIYDFRILGDDALVLLRGLEEFAGLEHWFAPGNFTDKKINARGRKRSEFVDRLLQVGGVANLASRVIPRRLLFAIRRWMELRGAQGVEGNTPPPVKSHDPRHLEQVERLFARDRAYVRELFADGPLVVGAG